jgi:hypothetical protein
MRRNLIGVLGCAALLMGVPMQASVTVRVVPSVSAARKVVAASRIDDAQRMRESLRRDVARHPGDFVVFATETGARQFFLEHRADADVENDPKMVARGVVGYWQGKTIVILPLPALAMQ